MDPERITRGVISLTTGDSRRGSLGSIFRFLGLCVCLGVQRGLSRVLIKYFGNVRLQIVFRDSRFFLLLTEMKKLEISLSTAPSRESIS